MSALGFPRLAAAGDSGPAAAGHGGGTRGVQGHPGAERTQAGAGAAPECRPRSKAARSAAAWISSSSRQNANGSWGSSRAAGPTRFMPPCPAPIPSFRGAVTSLCISALMEAGDASARGRALSRSGRGLADGAPACRPPQVPIQADPGFKGSLYNNWCHAYSLRRLAAHAASGMPATRSVAARSAALIAQQIDMLVRYECVDGGWCYYDIGRPDRSAQRLDDQFRDRHGAGGTGRRPQGGDGGAAKDRRSGDGLDHAAAEAPTSATIYGEYLKYQPMLPVNRPERQPGPLAGLQPGHAGLGRQAGDRRGGRDLARPALRPRAMARPGPQDGRFRTSRGSRWPAISFTTAITMPRRCIEHLARGRAARRYRTNWPRFFCGCRTRTVAGGISRCTITISSTARPLR